MGDCYNRRVFGSRDFPYTEKTRVIGDNPAYSGVPAGTIRMIKSDLKIGVFADTAEDGIVGIAQVAGYEPQPSETTPSQSTKPLARYMGTAVEQAPGTKVSQRVVKGRKEPVNILLVVPSHGKNPVYPASPHYIASALISKRFLALLASRLNKENPHDAFYGELAHYSPREMPEFNAEVLDLSFAGKHFDFKEFLEGKRREEKKEYHIIGFSTFTEGFKQTKEAMETAREVSPQSALIAGGWHASALPEDTIAETGCDLLVKGQGVEAMADIALRLYFSDETVSSRNQIKEITPFSRGMYHEKTKGSFVYTGQRPRLFTFDEYPFPHKSFGNALFPPPTHREVFGNTKLPEDVKFANIFSSIGCPFSCKYCAVHVINTRRIERNTECLKKEIERDIGCLKKEIEELFNNGYRRLSFSDDIIALKEERVLEISQMMREFKERADREGSFFAWECMMRADVLTEDMLRAMQASGLVEITFGIESGDINVARYVKNTPKLSEEKIARIIRTTLDMGIYVGLFMQIGQPDESVQSVLRSARFAVDTDGARLSVFRTRAYPGSEYFDANNNGPVKMCSDITDHYAEALSETDTLTCDEITFLRKCLMDLDEYTAFLLGQAHPQKNGRIIQQQEKAVLGLLRIATIVDLVIRSHPSLHERPRPEIYQDLMSTGGTFYRDYDQSMMFACKKGLKPLRLYHQNPYKFMNDRPVNGREFDRFLTSIEFNDGFELLKTFDPHKMYGYAMLLFRLWKDSGGAFTNVRLENVDALSIRRALHELMLDSESGGYTLRKVFGPETQMDDGRLEINDVSFSVAGETLTIKAC